MTAPNNTTAAPETEAPATRLDIRDGIDRRLAQAIALVDLLGHGADEEGFDDNTLLNAAWAAKGMLREAREMIYAFTAGNAAAESDVSDQPAMRVAIDERITNRMEIGLCALASARDFLERLANQKRQEDADPIFASIALLEKAGAAIEPAAREAGIFQSRLIGGEAEWMGLGHTATTKEAA